MKKIIVLLGATALMLALVSVALAHAQIISCTPDIGGTVATAPDKVTCKTSEAMDPKGSSLAVFDSMGMQVDKKDSAVDLNDADRVTVAVSLDAAMVKDGTYTVKWTTLSAADGDEASGEFQFAVGASPVKLDPTATAEPEGTQAAPLPEGTIKIVSPADKATVRAGKTAIQIALVGVTLGTYHWHVMLDGNMVTMITNNTDTATIDIPAGEHDIEVSLADEAHTDLAQAKVHVTAQGDAANAQATVTAEPTMAMDMGTATPEPTKGAEPTVAPTAVPTAAPTTLPTSGSDANTMLYTLAALFGAMVLGAGAFAALCARR